MTAIPQLAVIGAGQLGSRHLQAIARLDRPAMVHVVDPFPASLTRAKERFDEVAANGTSVELKLAEQLTALPQKLDAVVIATNADQRADVCRRLLAHAQVRYLVLEKVLFQRDNEYGEIGDRLAQAGTKTWVNCPRRMSPGYRQLKADLHGVGPLASRLTGGGWGLACNSIHFLDHLAFLIGRDDLELTTVDLQPEVLTSKRAGFVEFLGRLSGRFGDGSTVELECLTETPSPLIIEIETGDQRLVIREDQQSIQFFSKADGSLIRTLPLPPVYQSQLTQLVVQELLDHGRCPLTPYAESCRLHRPFLAALLEHYRRQVSPGAVACPIT